MSITEYMSKLGKVLHPPERSEMRPDSGPSSMAAKNKPEKYHAFPGRRKPTLRKKCCDREGKCECKHVTAPQKPKRR